MRLEHGPGILWEFVNFEGDLTLSSIVHIFITFTGALEQYHLVQPLILGRELRPRGGSCCVQSYTDSIQESQKENLGRLTLQLIMFSHCLICYLIQCSLHLVRQVTSQVRLKHSEIMRLAQDFPTQWSPFLNFISGGFFPLYCPKSYYKEQNKKMISRYKVLCQI